MLKNIAFTLLTMLFAAAALGQAATEISGRVIDATTKEPLEYVNIRLHGSIKVTFTDPKGQYLVRTIEKVDSISFSYLGYKTRTIAVKKGAVQELNIEMGSDDLMLKEVTVKAGKRRKREIDTAANYVFYKVLEFKSQNRDNNIPTYKYEKYERLRIALLNPKPKFINFFLWKPFHFAFENKDTTETGNVFIPGLIKERISTVYYQKQPQKTKEYVTTDVMTGVDNPSAGGMANFYFSYNDPYENLFLIAGTPFIAPFNNNGTVTYRYYLTDTALLDGRVSYKLHFTGKVKQDLAMTGYAWIDSATWAIRSIVYRPNSRANLNFVNEYAVKNDFTLVNGKYWMMSREELNTVGSLLKKGKLGIFITKVTARKNYETDIPLADSIFKGTDQTIIDDSARVRKAPYLDAHRFDSLSVQDRRVYGISDSIKMIKAWKTYQWFGRFFTAAYADAGPISIGRVLNFASRNNIEGWRVRFGFETNPRFQHRGTPANEFLHKFYYAGYIAYGFKDKDYKYLSVIRLALPRKNDRWQSLEFMYRYDMRVPGQDENQTLLTFDNIVTLISGRQLTKIMKVREAGITYEKEYVKDFSATIAITDKVYYDIPGVFDFRRTVGDRVERVPNFNVTEFMVDTRYCYKDLYFVGNFYRYFQPNQRPIFMLRYIAGVVSMQQDNFTYHNLHLTIRQKLRSALGFTNYIFRAGKIFGKVPYTSSFLTQGNLGVLLDKFNYNLLREFEFVSDQYASFWVEQHFNGYFFNKIPGINRLKLREVVTFKSLIGSFSKKNADMLTLPFEATSPGPVPYIEMGVGIENILYMFRVDFLWRVTYRDRTGVPNWGIKFAFQPNF